jgi:hypothetical protein
VHGVRRILGRKTEEGGTKNEERRTKNEERRTKVQGAASNVKVHS